MEFFEEAHVQISDNLKKDSKEKLKVKKQLKQMLHGYKVKDNDLIKNSENIINEFDDSASVSGFSDLILTNSSYEDDLTENRFDSSNIESLPEISVGGTDVFSEIPFEDQEHLRETNSEFVNDSDLLCRKSSQNTFSEEIQSTEENISSVASDELSITFSFAETSSTNSDSSNFFDADGILASKIHDNLKNVNTHKNESKVHTSKTIQKLVKNKIIKNKSLKKSKKLRRKKIDVTKVSISEDSLQEQYSIKKDNFIKLDNGLSNRCSVLEDNSQSQPFVSVTVNDMGTQKFEEVIGYYRHTTVKNITSDVANISLSPLNPPDDWRVKDIEINEEADSLMPELDTELAIEDVDTDLIETDSLRNQNDNINLCVESSQSEITTDVLSIERPLDSIEKIQVFYGKNSCIFVLRYPSSIFLHGKVIVNILCGTAQIFGYTVRDGPCEVYAPFYNYAQCLKSVKNNNDYCGLFNTLISYGLSTSESEEIVTTHEEFDVVVALEKFKDVKMDFVENNFKTTSLFSKVDENIELKFKKASELLGCSLYSTQPYKHLEESPNWVQAVQFGFCDKSRGIVCGGKGSGKSTFLRYYVNQLLSAGPVLVVDLDPGQCEFNVAGNISATVVDRPLLGPNFTHLRRPEIMLNIGMINTMDNPKRYLAAVDYLVSYCNNDEHLRRIPWIVNTMGMCNAFGLKFMYCIILRVQPTFVLQIELQTLSKNYGMRLTPYNVKKLYEDYQHDRMVSNVTCPGELSYQFIISPAETYRANTNKGTDNFALAPRDERYLNLLAYFGELLKINVGLSILEITPYLVHLKDMFITANITIQEESITKVLNGKVVALCQLSTPSDKTAKMFTLDDKPLLCYGHGLVRGIDWEKELLYIISPISSNDLVLVNTILYADWVPEISGLEKNLPPGVVVPYRTHTKNEQKRLMIAPRRRFNPLQLLRMSRSS